MKKFVLLVSTLMLFTVLAIAADSSPKTSAPAQAQAQAPASGSESSSAPGLKTVPVPDRPCSSFNFLESPEALKAAGFKVDTQPISGGGGTPNCPSISGTCASGANVSCNATGCSSADTGYGSCKLPNGHVLDCGGEGTIHVVSCTGCVKDSEAACCSQQPPCLCGTCTNGPNQTLTCQ